MSLEESIALVEKFQKELAQLESDKREIKNNEEERRKPIEVNVRRRSMFRYFWPWIIFAATELCLLLFISLIFLMSSHPNIGFIMNIGSYVFAAVLIVIGIIVSTKKAKEGESDPGHRTTLEWYIVDRKTGLGKNFAGEDVDLTSMFKRTMSGEEAAG